MATKPWEMFAPQQQGQPAEGKKPWEMFGGKTLDDSPGIISNSARNAGESALDIVGNLVKFVGSGSKAASQFDASSPVEVVGAGMWALRSPTNPALMALGRSLWGDKISQAGDEISGVSLGYKPNYTIDRMLDEPSLKTLGGAVVEQGPASLAHMAAMAISAPAYLASQTQNIADQRAENNGQDEAGMSEYAVALPAAAASLVLDRLALGKLIHGAGKGAPTIGRAIARGATAEGATEAVQSGIEYAGATAGTEQGFDLTQLKRQTLGGGVLGAAMGGGVAGAVHGAGRFRQRQEAESPLDEPGQAEAEAPQSEAVQPGYALTPTARTPEQYDYIPAGEPDTFTPAAPQPDFVVDPNGHAAQYGVDLTSARPAYALEDKGIIFAGDNFQMDSRPAAALSPQFSTMPSGQVPMDVSIRLDMQDRPRLTGSTVPRPDMTRQAWMDGIGRQDGGVADAPQSKSSQEAGAAPALATGAPADVSMSPQPDSGLTLRYDGKPFKTETLTRMSRGYREAVQRLGGSGVEVVPVDGGYAWRPVANDKRIAADIEVAAAQVQTDPTDAQKEAGNYRKGHVRINGLDIAIENPRGSVRSGTDEDGNAWESRIAHHYGYVKRTNGADGDAVDVYIGPNPSSDTVYVVNQVNPKTGHFDEHKAMLGFDSQQDAEQGYLDNYAENWQGLGNVTPMSTKEFKAWLKEGDTTAPTSQHGALVEHITGKGKTLRGVVRADLTKDEAQAVDPYTFKKDGGWFIREREIGKLPPVKAMPKATGAAEQSPELTQQTTGVAPKAPAPDRTAERRKLAVAELRASAAKITAKAQAEQSRDRLTNTAKRASQAAGSLEQARRDEAMGKTLANLADAIEGGRVKALAGVTSRTQIELLQSIRQRAIPREKLTSPTFDGYRMGGYAEKDGVSVDQFADKVTYPRATLHPEQVGEAVAILEQITGKGAKEYQSLAKALRAERNRWDGRGVMPLSEETAKRLAAIDAKTSPDPKLRRLWPQVDYAKEALARINRLKRAGIETKGQLIDALRELEALGEKPAAEPRLKQLERELIGKKIPGYHNTTGHALAIVLEQANIQPGDSVLEPSAGKGDMADAAKEAGAEVDVIEINGNLRGILEEKGHNVVASDFMDFKTDKRYDVVLMNPPFENGQDMAHTRKAWDLVKPGGRLVSILGAGVTFNGSRAHQEFRTWVDEMGGALEKLPEGSFKGSDQSTGTNAVYLVLDKPEAEAPTVKDSLTVERAEDGAAANLSEKPEGSVRGDQGAKDAAAFIDAPGGGIDFGEISPEVAEVIGRQPGKIRLQQGEQRADGTGYGLAHIEARHGSQIRNAGFDSVEQFVSAAIADMDSIWRPGRTAQIVAIKSKEKGKAVFIELQPATDEAGDFYRVNSAFPVNPKFAEKKEEKEGWERLWSRYPVSAGASGAAGFVGQTPNAGESAPTVSPQSNGSIAPAQESSKAKLTDQQPDAKLALSDQMLADLREKYGSVENWWRDRFGFGFDALTESEARYLIKSDVPPERLRDRISEAGPEGLSGLPESAPRFKIEGVSQEDKPANGGLLFSRFNRYVSGILPTIRMPREQAEKAVAQFLAEWQAKYKPSVVIQERQGDVKGLPSRADEIVRAFYEPDQQRVTLILENIRGRAELVRILRHEILVHHGLRGVVDPVQYEHVMSEIIAARNLGGKVGEIWQQVLRDYAELNQREQAEEVLAKIGESDMVGMGATFYRVVAAIRKVLRAIGFIRDDVPFERMVEFVRSIAEGQRQKGAGPVDVDSSRMFSRTNSTKTSYERRIDDLFSGGKPRYNGQKILDRADILDLLGFGNKPLHLVESAVNKPEQGGRREDGSRHPEMTAEQWKKVPEWIEDPVAVFESATVPGRLTLIAPELVNGKPVVVILQPNGKMGGMDVHVAVNAYSKDNAPMGRWVSEGGLRYLNQKESPEFAERSGLQLPGEVRQLRGYKQKVLTDDDLVKYRERVNENRDTRFSKTAADQYREDLARAMKSLRSNPQPIRVGRTPDIMIRFGAPDLELFIRKDTVTKATNGVKESHDVPMSVIERLPELISDPVAVLDDSEKGPAQVLIVDAMTGSGRPVAVAIHLQVNEGRLVVNRIASAYGRDNFKRMTLKYLEKDKNPDLVRLIGPQLPLSGSPDRGSTEKVLNKSDLVNENRNIRFSKTAADKIGERPMKSYREQLADFASRMADNLGDKAKRKQAWFDFEKSMLDRYLGIKAAEAEALAKGASITAENSAYIAARMSAGSGDVINAVFEYGAPEWRGGVIDHKAGTKGLMEVFSDLGDAEAVNDWLAWMAGHRAERLAQQGRENNLNAKDIAELKARVKGRESKFRQAKKDYNAIMSALLDLQQAAGLINPVWRKQWEDEWYIPFYRATETADGAEIFKPPYGKQTLANQKAAIKQLKGGEQATNDLLQNIMTNVALSVDAAMKAEAMRRAVTNLEPAGAIELIEGEPTFEDGKEQRVITVRENGIPRKYRVLDTNLLEAVTQVWWTPEGSRGKAFETLVGKPGRMMKRLLTTGVTADPSFILRNMIRDSLQAWMINPGQFKLGVDSVKGLVSTMQNSENYRRLMFHGAAFENGYINSADPDGTAKAVRTRLNAMSRKARFKSFHLLDTPEKAWDGVVTAWKWYQDKGSRVENANRLATYERVLADTGSRAEAAYAARDFMDFSLTGSSGVYRAVAELVPFMNARVQGLYKLARAGGVPAIRHRILTTGLKMAVLSTLLALWNRDDERYDSLPEEMKDLYWNFWVADQHFAIPKPFELGFLFATVPERLGLAVFGGPDDTFAKAGKQIVWNLAQTMNLLAVPQAVAPMIELAMNRDMFRQAPIETIGDQRLQKQDRYNENTSETAKELSAIGLAGIGLSPKQVEHLIKGYAGSLGGYALGVSDMLARYLNDAPKQPSMRVRDIPGIGAIFKGENPSGTRYEREFYDLMSKTEEAHASLRAMIKANNRERVNEIREKDAAELALYGMVAGVSEQATTLRNQIKIIQRRRDLSADEKRKRIDDLMRRKNKLFKYAMDSARKKMAAFDR